VRFKIWFILFFINILYRLAIFIFTCKVMWKSQLCFKETQQYLLFFLSINIGYDILVFSVVTCPQGLTIECARQHVHLCNIFFSDSIIKILKKTLSLFLSRFSCTTNPQGLTTGCACPLAHRCHILFSDSINFCQKRV
jgi:hypothetical protein